MHEVPLILFAPGAGELASSLFLRIYQPLIVTFKFKLRFIDYCISKFIYILFGVIVAVSRKRLEGEGKIYIFKEKFFQPIINK